MFLESLKSASAPTEDSPILAVNIPLETRVDDGSIINCALALVPRLEVKTILFPLIEAVTPVIFALNTLTQDCKVLV